MELVCKIRKNDQLPNVYFIMRSWFSQLKEIREGLKIGVDDYFLYLHNNAHIRSRFLVGRRWLACVDSITVKKRVIELPLQAMAPGQNQQGDMAASQERTG